MSKESLSTQEKVNMDADTIPKVFLQLARKYGDRKIGVVQKERGVWREYTWEEQYQIVKNFCLGLIDLGLEPDDRISIIGDNDRHWFWACYAAMARQAAVVGLYVDSLPAEVKYIVEHSDSTFVVASDQEQVDKLLSIKDELPLLKKVIYWDPKGLRAYDDPILMHFQEVVELGKKCEADHPGTFEANIERTNEKDKALIVYTSGTSGIPKGAIWLHKNLMVNMGIIDSVLPWYETDRYISVVSPGWIGEQIICPMALKAGAEVYYPEEGATVQENVREVAPTFVFYATRYWESVASMVLAKMIDASRFKRFLYQSCLPIGYKMVAFEMEEKKPNLLWRIAYKIAEGMVFRPLRDKIGMSSARWVLTAGATISPDSFIFFRAIGVDLRQFWGGTEHGLCTMQYPGELKGDSAGRPLAGVEIRVSSDSELLARGGNIFSGYHKSTEATNKALEKEGWFHTGDAGYIDEDGHLIFLDRLDDLRELASGHKYAPQYIESKLRFSSYIRDAMIIGDKSREYPIALIGIDFENVARWAEAKRIAYTTSVDLSQREEIRQLIQRDLEKVDQTLPEGSRVGKFINLHKEFDPDEAELTRTRKVRRGFLEDRYKDLIDSIYKGDEEFPIETTVTYHDGRKGVIKATIKINTLSGAQVK